MTSSRRGLLLLLLLLLLLVLFVLSLPTTTAAAAPHLNRLRCASFATTPVRRRQLLLTTSTSTTRLPSCSCSRPHHLHSPSPTAYAQQQPSSPGDPPPSHHRQLLHRRGGAFRLEADVVKASLTAVAELMISCGIGAAAARKGVLDRVVISSLSTVVFNIFQPALLCSNVARTVYHRPLRTLLPISGFATVQVILCGAIASLMNAAVLRLDPRSTQGREVGVLSTFGNSGVLPLLFTTVLLRHAPDPTALPLAISYISFFLLGWYPWFWTLGYAWLAGPTRLTRDGAQPVTQPTTPLPPRSGGKALGRGTLPVLRRILCPPILGCLAGLLLGTSPLGPLFLGAEAPLAVVTNAVETMGKAYPSCALLIIAGSMALQKDADPRATSAPPPSSPEQQQSRPAVHPALQIASICLVRFCLCPLLFLGIVLNARSRGLVALDRYMLFVLFLESCMPPAQNTVIMYTLEGRPADGTRLARLLLSIYVFSCVPLGILLTLYLQRFGL